MPAAPLSSQVGLHVLAMREHHKGHVDMPGIRFEVELHQGTYML